MDRRRDLAGRRRQTIEAGPPWHGVFLFCVCNARLYIFLDYSSESGKHTGSIPHTISIQDARWDQANTGDSKKSYEEFLRRAKIRETI